MRLWLLAALEVFRLLAWALWLEKLTQSFGLGFVQVPLLLLLILVNQLSESALLDQIAKRV